MQSASLGGTIKKMARPYYVMQDDFGRDQKRSPCSVDCGRRGFSVDALGSCIVEIRCLECLGFRAPAQEYP